MFSPMTASLEKLCSIQLRPPEGDKVHRDTEDLRGLLKCQSHDFIVTAHTCTGNASPPDSLKSYPNPYSQGAQMGRNTKLHQRCKRHTVSPAKERNPKGPWD